MDRTTENKQTPSSETVQEGNDIKRKDTKLKTYDHLMECKSRVCCEDNCDDG